ncbi:PPC domain-containing protein [Brevundimonas sp.]|uniref:PPC domain-containing protein n=1 Tax=Brevundimonas sp. TaxID=1871086 RepID=UPI0035618574
MRRQTILATVGSLALMCAVFPAWAQSPEPLAPGATVQGAIVEGDATTADYRHDDFAVAARRGQRFEAVLRSEAFDAYLEVFRPGEATEAFVMDDDGLGEDTDARLRFTADQDGTYILRARPLSGLEAGDYRLTLTQRPAARPAPRPSSIRIGRAARGDLSGGDPETETSLPYDAYAFRARGGDRIAVALDSEDFDPVLLVGQMGDGEFAELARNDDGPDSGLNSRLIFTAPASGDYVIRVTPLNATGVGGYSLNLEQGPAPAVAQAIEIGATVQGSLTNTDSKGENGAAADAYRFQGSEGQRVRIDMASDDFDAFLELFDENRISLGDDDDGAAEGTDSRLTFVLPRTGSYIVEARAFSQGTGGYSLAILEVAPDRAPDAIAFGSTLQGEIVEDDPRDDEERGFDAFAFSGVEGQRIQAIMRSGDFDTYLQLGKAGGEFEQLAEDDDGLGEGFDSRLSFTLPDTGDYVLRAMPYKSEEDGLYALELIDRGPQPLPGSVLIGATARGTLSETDATADDNSYFDAYRITVKEDEKLLITMVSNEVDSFLVIGRDKADGAFEALTSDDDGLSDTHAKIEWTAPADGTYEIRAGSFQQGQTGAYAMNVEK